MNVDYLLGFGKDVCKSTCIAPAYCVPTTNSGITSDFTCACTEGYSLTDEGACVGTKQQQQQHVTVIMLVIDVDECAAGLDYCVEPAACVNDSPGYHCACVIPYFSNSHGTGCYSMLHCT